MSHPSSSAGQSDGEPNLKKSGNNEHRPSAPTGREQSLPPQGYPQPAPTCAPVRPIVIQPAVHGIHPDAWRNIPNRPTNYCPPGLEYLTMIDKLLVHQRVEVAEVRTGFETRNTFQITNRLGQQIYYAVEDSDCLVRNCYASDRSFSTTIFDHSKNEVIHVYRPLRCCLGTLTALEVYSPPGTLAGIVQQEWGFMSSNFAVKIPNGETILKIRGPNGWAGCCKDVQFQILSADGKTQLGKITRVWTGFNELLTDGDHFGISFPVDLDVKIKAVLIGACILIDVLFFSQE